MNRDFFINMIEQEEAQEEVLLGDFIKELSRPNIPFEEKHVQNRVNREAGRACAMLMKEHILAPQVQIDRAINKITEFVDCMDGLFNLDDDLLFLDTSDEECVSIKFKRDKSMSLDIYFDDDDDLVNEAYLSFMVKGKLQIMNDSIPNIALVIKDLLM